MRPLPLFPRDALAHSCSHTAFDAHHLNAVSRDDAGNFLISLRGPSTVYYISRETGEILWRLGGLKSSFKMGEKCVQLLATLPESAS